MSESVANGHGNLELPQEMQIHAPKADSSPHGHNDPGTNSPDWTAGLR